MFLVFLRGPVSRSSFFFSSSLVQRRKFFQIWLCSLDSSRRRNLKEGGLFPRRALPPLALIFTLAFLSVVVLASLRQSCPFFCFFFFGLRAGTYLRFLF